MSYPGDWLAKIKTTFLNEGLHKDLPVKVARIRKGKLMFQFNQASFLHLHFYPVSQVACVPQPGNDISFSC